MITVDLMDKDAELILAALRTYRKVCVNENAELAEDTKQQANKNIDHVQLKIFDLLNVPPKRWTFEYVFEHRTMGFSNSITVISRTEEEAEKVASRSIIETYGDEMSKKIRVKDPTTAPY